MTDLRAKARQRRLEALRIARDARLNVFLDSGLPRPDRSGDSVLATLTRIEALPHPERRKGPLLLL